MHSVEKMELIYVSHGTWINIHYYNSFECERFSDSEIVDLE